MPNILLVSSDSSEKDVIIEFIKSLEQLEIDSSQIFCRISSRLLKCQERIQNFNARLDILDKKVVQIKNVSINDINNFIFCSK